MKMNCFKQFVVNLEEEEVEKFLQDFLSTRPSKEEVQRVLSTCREAMAMVGRKFEKREYLIGDVIYAGELQRNIIEILEPIMSMEKLNSPNIVLDNFYVDSLNIGEKVFRNILKTAGYEIVT